MANAAETTALATALKLEYQHRLIAMRLVDEVLLDEKANATAREASLLLIDWLARPAELLLRPHPTLQSR